MGIDLNSNYTIYLYTGLNNLRTKIKYILKVRPVQGQLMLQEILNSIHLECLKISYFKQVSAVDHETPNSL